ncbi:DUF1310 domain-containing protein [Streptococcus uberis]|nr:DUF1310 family protein [Streptococcus uberis]MCK1255341.1 DUF1310 domain-containing protein [Streptococcus uberis]
MNFKKVIYIFLGLLIAVGILVGGHKLQEKREYDQMVEIVESKEVKHLIEDDFKYFDKSALKQDAIIKSYHIEKNTIRKNPMGGIMFKVIVNNQKDHYIRYTIIKGINGKDIDVSGQVISEELNRELKDQKL